MQNHLPFLLALLFGIQLVTLGFLFVMHRRFRNLLRGHTAADNLTEIIITNNTAIEKLSKELRALEMEKDRLAKILQKKLAEVQMVRYDALPDTGGKQSFSLLLTNAEKNGVLISSLYLRDRTHLFAKEVRNGKVERNLSEEETQLLTTIQS